MRRLQPLVLVLGLPACAPSGELGFCDEAMPCIGRGQVCDTVEHVCLQEEFSPTSTEEGAPADFTDKIVPFFRGRVCIPLEVQAGSRDMPTPNPIPISIEACLHPCLDVTSSQFKHHYECVGSSCLAYATMWVVADSAMGGCPPEAFGQFDRSQCQTVSAELAMNIEEGADDEPVVGSMLLEIPYLSNADMEVVAAEDDQDVTQERIEQYPQSADRIPGERAIWVLPHLPPAPDSCVGNDDCVCSDIGF